jgi:hypothetical protein
VNGFIFGVVQLLGAAIVIAGGETVAVEGAGGFIGAAKQTGRCWFGTACKECRQTEDSIGDVYLFIIITVEGHQARHWFALEDEIEGVDHVSQIKTSIGIGITTQELCSRGVQ